jgi:hypothetical protein
MDLAFNLKNVSPDRPGDDAERAGAPFRWPDLLLRLAAAREASHAMTEDFAPALVPGRGSFDEAVASYLSAYVYFPRNVNPNSLADCNREPDTSANVAGPTRTGGRG